MLVFALAMAAAHPCTGSTTPEVDACLAQQADAAQAELDRYLAAARRALETDDAELGAGAPKLLAGFDDAEVTWARYRDQQCGNIYDRWRGGTIRNAKALACRISVTEERTHMIWRLYLTYPDSTPPVLPEPGTD